MKGHIHLVHGTHSASSLRTKASVCVQEPSQLVADAVSFMSYPKSSAASLQCSVNVIHDQRVETICLTVWFYLLSKITYSQETEMKLLAAWLIPFIFSSLILMIHRA